MTQADTMPKVSHGYVIQWEEINDELFVRCTCGWQRRMDKEEALGQPLVSLCAHEHNLMLAQRVWLEEHGGVQ